MRLGFCATVALSALAIGMTIDAGAARAQRATENALTSAQDAFGTTVGNESIGLYTSRDVRGFDPVQAGNVRLEGLYFDRQTPGPYEIFTNTLVTGSSIRVGLSAQSYPFPAPTGIADMRLRIPGEKRIDSLVVTQGPYSKYAAELDSQIPIIPERLSMSIGLGYTQDDLPYAARPVNVLAAAVARWRPSEDVEILPFWSRKTIDRLIARPNIYATGSTVPPRIPRHVMYMQTWFQNTTDDTNFGVIANTSLSQNWRLRAGVFRSLVVRDKWSSNLFQNTQPDGTADHSIALFPKQRFGSVSGEVRASGVMTAGAWRHTVHVAGRGRLVARNFGGTTTKPLGVFTLGVPRVVAEPTYSFGALSNDRARQGTGGLAYEAIWAGVGEFSLGLQKTYYRRTLKQPTGADTVTRDSPFLPNGTIAIRASDKLVAFASFTRGLEESGEAPNIAANRGEALPAIRTSQLDAGLRYAITPRISAVTTLFEVKKPYLNLNTANLFARVGDVRHRGVELSVAGKVTDSLTIVAGSVFLKARIAGTLVDQGRIGRVPIGRIPRVSRLNVDYGPPAWKGLSADMQLENLSSRIVSVDNTARIPGRTTINLGGRYRFKILDAPATLRLQAQNVTNVFGWEINTMQLSFETNERRRVTANLAIDF